MDYHENERLAVLLSREVRDGEISACGALSMLPASGLLLAQATHAPNAQLIILGSNIMPFRTSRQFHYLAQRGELGLFFVSGVQIDQEANYNLHMVGLKARPTRRFPGGYGGGMIYYCAKRSVVFRTEHSKRSLVKKVDYISAAGFTPSHIKRDGGPSKVITPMASLRFNPNTQRLTLESVHAPYSQREVMENTGFDLGDPSKAGQTPEPSAEELNMLRTVVRKRMLAENVYPQWAKQYIRNPNAA